MYYFRTQEEAIQLFNKIGQVPEGTKEIFLIVNKAKDIKPLQKDLATLLQRFPLEIKRNSVRIKGTKNNPALKVILITNEPAKVKGLPKETTIYLSGKE